jgi:CRP-like cAMP-binding protein
MSKKRPPSQDDHLNDHTLDEELEETFEQDTHSPLSNRDSTVIETIDERVGVNPRERSISKSKFSLPLTGVFKHLSPLVKRKLLLVGRRIQYEEGTLLNNVGDSCQGLSFILGGQVRVEWMDALNWVPIAVLTAGDVFGAMEWAEGKIWEERLTAETSALVLFIPTAVLNPLSATYPDLQRQVERYTERHTLHALLGANSLFHDIPNQSLMNLIDIASMRYLDPGSVIYSPERVISLLFVVGRGEVELLCEDRVVQIISRGELANLELALGDGINMTMARILSPVTLYVLPFDKIELLMAESGQLYKLQRMAQLLRSRALNE